MEKNGKEQWIYKGNEIPEAQALSIKEDIFKPLKYMICNNLPFKIQSVEISFSAAIVSGSVTVEPNEFCKNK